MINIYCNTPTELLLQLGGLFFSKKDNPVNVYVGDRRFVSSVNTFNILSWPKEWTGKALFELVGYSDSGTKMTTLRKTYVDEDKLKELKERLKTSKGFEILGMPFKMTMERKGGCLNGLHILRSGKDVTLFVHGKIAEIPRKFMADLLLVRDLIKELGLKEPKVIFQYSLVYFSIVTLRAYVPIMGYKNINHHRDLPIMKYRNYQVGTQESLLRIRKELCKKYSKDIMDTGVFKYLNYRRGEWLE